MRIKTGPVVAAIVAALCCGYFAHGQSREKTSEAVRKEADAGKKVTATPKTGADQSKNLADTGKKSADSTKTTGAKPAASDAAESADEQALRGSAEAFTKLYNAHDSKGLAALFAAKAEMIDEADEVVKGREAIGQAFADVFKANPKSSIEILVESLRVLTPSLAIEEGTARSRVSPDDPEDLTTYIAIHVKTDGKWVLACVRDWAAPPAEPTPHQRLQELAWLLGDWLQESSDSVIRTRCKWDDTGNYLIQDFSVQVFGNIAMSGTMRIGWDAVRKQFKSWVFDSHGGHVEGYWLRDGDQWIVKSQGATAVGESASATTVYHPIDDDTIVWSSSDRIVDGERREDIEPITVKRHPPLPAE
jgi:uncharacterized protein (TIGR02246 family)